MDAAIVHDGERSVVVPRKVVGAIIALCALLMILSMRHPLEWDEAVFVEMGKYLASHGEVGFFEVIRPPLLPTIIGGLWRLGFDPLIAGRLLAIAASVGALLLVYRIGLRAFDVYTAAIATALCGSSSIFIEWSSYVMSDAPAMFLVVLSLYLLIEERPLLAGLVVGCAFLTRFVSLLVIVPYLIVELARPGQRVTRIARLLLPAGALACAFLLVNRLNHGSALLPITLGSRVAANDAIAAAHPSVWVYVEGLLKDNPLLFAALFAPIHLIAESRAVVRDHALRARLAIALTVSFVIAYFVAIAHREVRYLVIAIPMLALLSAWVLRRLALRLFGERRAVFGVLICALLTSAQWATAHHRRILSPAAPVATTVFAQFLRDAKPTRPFWISSPVQILNTDLRADLLIYFPTWNVERAITLRNQLPNQGTIFLNTCDVECTAHDSPCERATAALLSDMNARFERRMQHSDARKCEHVVFTSRHLDSL